MNFFRFISVKTPKPINANENMKSCKINTVLNIKVSFLRAVAMH
jgi:hypothetical protein